MPDAKMQEAEACVARIRLLRGGLMPRSTTAAGGNVQSDAATMAAALQSQALALIGEAAGVREDTGGGGVVTGGSEQELEARRLWIRGEALISIDEGCPSQEAEGYLTRAVKADPSLVDAWNALGECFWRKGEVDLSEHCVRRGLENGRSAHGLRMLSMILRRTKRGETTGTAEAANESVALAKEALGMCLDSCESWECLGNAYLNQFFAFGSSSLDCLKLAQKAYGKAAAKDEGAFRPDLFYNRATACRYAADFEEALNSFSMVSSLDAARPCAIEKEEIFELLRSLHASVHSKGGLKQKRLQLLRSQLQSRAEALGCAGALADLDGGRNANSLWCVTLGDIEDPQEVQRRGEFMSWRLAVSHDEIFFALCCYGPRLTGMLSPGTVNSVRGAVLGRVFANNGGEVYDFPMVLVDGESSIRVQEKLKVS